MGRVDFKKNILTYYLYTIFSNLIILGPIIVIYLEAKGLNFTQIMLLNSVSAISVFIFEIPTGAVADKIGRRQSLSIGAALWGLSLSLYVLGKSFVVFALAEITFALGGSFLSGADTALIYDSLKVQNLEREFQRIEGRAKSYSFYAQAAGSIAAGFLYNINIELPMIVSAVFMIVTLIITLGFIEPPIENKKGRYGEKYFNQIKESGKYILSNEKVKAVMIFSMCFYSFYRAGFFMFQPYFSEVNIKVEYYGLIFFLFNIAAGITAKYCHIIMKSTRGNTLNFISFLMLLSFLALGFIKVPLGVAAMLLQQVARGLYMPSTRKYLNKNIPSDKRATILSFLSMLTNLTAAILYPFFGWIKDNNDIFRTHHILFILMFLLNIFTSLYMKRRIGQKKESEQ